MIFNLVSHSEENKKLEDKFLVLFKQNKFEEILNTTKVDNTPYNTLYLIDNIPQIEIKNSYIFCINPTLKMIDKFEKCQNNNIFVYLFTSKEYLLSLNLTKIFMYENCLYFNVDENNDDLLNKLLVKVYRKVYDIECTILNYETLELKPFLVNCDLYDLITFYWIMSAKAQSKLLTMFSGRVCEMFHNPDEFYLPKNKTETELLNIYKRLHTILNKYTYSLNEYKYQQFLQLIKYFS